MRRSLVRSLLDPQSRGIATNVQERVHSTTLGEDATNIFLLQVIEELEDASGEFLPFPPHNQPLIHENEVELGTLLSAASMTIRYVTMKQVMIPLLERYRDAFTKVLQYPVWTHTSYYGLKTVALMGSTRVLESFSDHVSTDDVVNLLRWLFRLFQDETIQAEERALRFNTLLRPACEYVAVALQTHGSAREMIFNEILPQLLELLIQENTGKHKSRVAEAVKIELATTAAVILDTKFAFTPPNTFKLLSLPEFVEEMEANGSKTTSSRNTTLAMKIEKLAIVDEKEEKGASTIATNELEEKCCRILCAWLGIESRRLVAAQALAVMYRALACTNDVDSSKKSAMALTTPLDEMTKALKDATLTTLHALNFIHALLESIRDIFLFKHKLAASTLENAFSAMSTVMSRLKVALTHFKKRSVERRNAKETCSSIRSTLVETFLAWLHHPDTAPLLSFQLEFLHHVAGTLADPRIYGDVLAVLRKSSVPEARTEYEAGRQLAVKTLCQAITQLDRYSKSTANRIVSGLTRIAAACREDVYPLADELVLPLLPSMLDGSEWGKFLRLRTEAVATVVLASAANKEFQVESHPWISDFVRFLLEPVVSSENVHSFMILCGLIRAEQKLLRQVVSFCMANPHTVKQTLHEPLTRWPLYEEDIDLVVITLELLEALLSVQILRDTVEVDVIYATILQLSENAASERLYPITVACKQILESLGSRAVK